MTPLALGIDIGGTKISIVLGNSRGKILARRVIPTQTGSRVSQCLQALFASLDSLIEESGVKRKEIAGVGVGIPGPVNTRTGIIPRSPNLKGWQGIALAKILKKHLGMSVVMANDANAAAIGEKVFGAGRGCSDFIYMTVSTGIGSGIVLAGKLLEGATFVAGEVGHMTIVPGGELCKCGKRGCLEAYASGTAIAREAAKIFGKGKEWAAKDVGALSASGNVGAKKIYQTAGSYLGIGIANLLNLINPEKVILGGGVWKSAPREFWTAMMKSCRKEAWPQAMQSVAIVRSKFADPGDLGALALVFEKLKE